MVSPDKPSVSDLVTMIEQSEQPCPVCGNRRYVATQWPTRSAQLLCIDGPHECDICGGTGYLLEQTYGYADVPVDWTEVQRCDTCKAFEGDGYAAEKAAADHGEVAVAYFFSTFTTEPNDLDEEGERYPGDYAIHTTIPQN